MSKDSDRVVVRKDKLARCMWCGSLESNNWITSEQGDIYCSPECMAAASVGRKKAGALLYIVCALAMMLFPLLLIISNGGFGIGPLLQLAIIGFFMVICGLIGYLEAIQGKKYQDRKGKYSGIPPLECEYCRYQNPPSATRCLNCDAPLSDAGFAEDALPPWISKQRAVKGVKCPVCGAIYSYSPEQISDDGTVHCQNCNRQFSVPSSFSIPEESNHYRY